MTEDEARKVELARAIESADHQALLVTREDREQATARARGSAPPGGGAKSAISPSRPSR